MVICVVNEPVKVNNSLRRKLHHIFRHDSFSQLSFLLSRFALLIETWQ